MFSKELENQNQICLMGFSTRKWHDIGLTSNTAASVTLHLLGIVPSGSVFTRFVRGVD